ncbi:hypothetical protein SCP_0405520 [Sparassis crispa]|uniref:Uncharacterized protein n=1 Tax=Sparassis crispa TaxID=139825 RepID=A0A401GJ27_9APHY|nr:hypothetical protein SCP_0405520 [Sparassis crispa]GBE82172.1 hypothetical protein SCP_0405520 [Sparassis crispa]
MPSMSSVPLSEPNDHQRAIIKDFEDQIQTIRANMMKTEALIMNVEEAMRLVLKAFPPQASLRNSGSDGASHSAASGL